MALLPKCQTQAPQFLFRQVSRALFGRHSWILNDPAVKRLEAILRFRERGPSCPVPAYGFPPPVRRHAAVHKPLENLSDGLAGDSVPAPCGSHRLRRAVAPSAACATDSGGFVSEAAVDAFVTNKCDLEDGVQHAVVRLLLLRLS